MPNDGQQGNGSKDPWGRKEEGPPDLFQLLKKAFGKKASADGGDADDGNHSSRFLMLIGILLILLWGLSGIFLVSPAEQAVVLRFGKYVDTLGPGPHWIPRFIESKYTLNVQQVNNFPYQAEMLTKDENIVSVSVAVQFRIADPEKFLFNVVLPVTTLQEATSSAMRQVVGQMSLDAVLTTGRQELRDGIAKQLNKTLAPYKTGLAVTDLTLQPTKPPEAVTQAFDDAIKAREDEQSYINKAEAYSRKVISIAQGKVARLQQSAKAYKKEIVLRAKGDVSRYLALLGPYDASPRVTRDRMYFSTMSNVLSHTTNIVVDSKGTNVLYLPIDKMLKQQRQTPDSTAAETNRRLDQLTSEAGDQRDAVSQTSVDGHRSRPSYPLGGER